MDAPDVERPREGEQEECPPGAFEKRNQSPEGGQREQRVPDDVMDGEGVVFGGEGPVSGGGLDHSLGKLTFKDRAGGIGSVVKGQSVAVIELVVREPCDGG